MIVFELKRQNLCKLIVIFNITGVSGLHRGLMKILKPLTIFIAGGFAYGLIEVLARGYTHISMGVLGGAAMSLIHFMNGGRRTLLRITGRAVLSAAFITTLELITGEILNIRMGMEIWDYSSLPYNFDGQICLEFSLIWLLLSIVAMLYDDLLRSFILCQRRRERTPKLNAVNAERTAA